ncbi:hypothetical protein IJI72_02200 [Candidatus Saccharibacteria bacterium]|nr:hypothetical protein [Candidatus Saccharibacteria bacterium]
MPPKTTNNLLSSKKNRLILFICAGLILILAGVLVAVLVRKTASRRASEESPVASENENLDADGTEDTDGPVEPEGASVPIEDAVAAAEARANSASFEESFNAKLELIDSYRAMEDYAAVDAVVASVDTGALTDRQLYYFAETAYFAYGDREEDYEKRDFYLSLKTEAKNRIYAQEHPELFNQ